MSAIFTALGRNDHYVSMRVHGNSAQIDFDPPDLPNKSIAVRRVTQGTHITSNFQSNASAHFSIPTPLTVERNAAFTFFGDFTRKPQPVFAGVSIWVVHIELYLNVSHVTFGDFTAMDGNRVLQRVKMDDMFNLSTDEFDEDVSPLHCRVYQTSLDRRLYSGLGLTFGMGFTEQSDITLIGAKAVFFY